MNDDYNKVYETLVNNDNDVIGLIAYGLYKNDKRKQIVDIKNQGKVPSKRDIERIENVLSSRIDFYTEKATQLLDGTVEFLIEDNRHSIYQRYFRIEEIESLNSKIEEINDNTKPKSLWAELKIEVLGNIAWAVILLLLTVLIYFLNDDVQGFRQKILKKIEDPAPIESKK